MIVNPIVPEAHIPMAEETLRIAGAALNQTPLHWENNLDNIRTAIQKARSTNARLLVLPELCITGYGCEDVFLSNWLAEKAMDKLIELLPLTDSITVCVGLPVKVQADIYNGVAVLHRGRVLGITLKQNLARDGVHYEPRWFRAWKPGEVHSLRVKGLEFPVGDLLYEINGFRLGIEICEDAWVKGRPGIRHHQQQADIIINPSASHFAMGKSSSREKLVMESSQALSCVYVYVNLLGNEAGRMIYDGDILIAQHGKLLAQNDRLSLHRVNVVDCNVHLGDVTRSEALPLTDGKEKNEELTRALTLGLYDYLRKSKARGYVLSLSGGADSATCAVLIAEMVRRVSHTLGLDVLRTLVQQSTLNSEPEIMRAILACAYQATKHSSEATRLAARTLARSIHATYYEWSVQEEIDSYTQKLTRSTGQTLNWADHDITLQNIQSRARSPLIWMLANLRNSILITTSNRSESDVGYTTMDGDTSGSLAPISGLDKPTILEWLRWAETEMGYTGLAQINRLKPTAELRPSHMHQSDEDDLMPYPIMRAIEEQAIYYRKTPLETFHALAPHYADPVMLKRSIQKFFRLWSANQWKRERLAPSFHLDQWNVDPRSWCRFPILSSGFEEELRELEDGC
jgi:NAD+ synthase (glutamine-hydrolysing)